MKLLDRLNKDSESGAKKSDPKRGGSSDAGEKEKPSDQFTRLSLEMCQGDDGTRPTDPSWPGAGVWWFSPAIAFDHPEPLRVGEPVTMFATIRNLGTADATSGFLEAAYNVWLGNESQGMQTFHTATLPVIPAGGVFVAEIPWTPPDEDSTHACVHVRVFDLYSLMHHGDRVLSWYSYENPQAGNRNVQLALIEDESQPVTVSYKARNTGKRPLKATLLATRIDRTKRAADVDERFPMPFAPSHAKSARPGLRLPPLAANGRWPREGIHSRFEHSRFGFTSRPAQTGKSKGTVDRPHAVLSLRELTLEPGEVRTIQFVVPAKEFPAPGHDALFQIDYQVGDAVPVQHFVRIAR